MSHICLVEGFHSEFWRVMLSAPLRLVTQFIQHRKEALLVFFQLLSMILTAAVKSRSSSALSCSFSASALRKPKVNVDIPLLGEYAGV